MKVKRFLQVAAGSIFLQVFCWAMYSLLKLTIWFCLVPAIVTAMLYFFLQKEQQTGLSRKCVFFAAVLLPFLCGCGITIGMLMQYPNLQLLSADLDGVSPLVETVGLYATRLAVNGVLLLPAALIESLRHKGGAGEEQNAES